MPKLSIISIEEELTMVKLYTVNNVSIMTLCDKYSLGKIKVKDILIKHGIEIKKKGAQVITGNSSEIGNSKVKLYEANDGKKLIAVCKKTGISFDDANNISGSLTRYILDTYGNVLIPSNTYQRKMYEMNNGKKWFEEYFEIKEIDIYIDITKKCPYCEWDTVDVDNLSGQFEVHMMNKHNLTIKEHLNNYPNDLNYFRKYEDGLKLNKIGNHVTCKICNQNFKYLTGTHLKTHGITLLDYRLKFPNDIVLSEDYTNKLRGNYKNGLGDYESVFTSKAHSEIVEQLKLFGIKSRINDKKVLDNVEIDIIIPELKLGIEYNGLYYHREHMGKSRNYHLLKTKAMNSNGYRLIHIFEDEWIKNKLLILNKIKHLCGINDSEIIGGRKCNIRLIDNKIKNNFLNINHIQGSDTSKISIGAEYGGKLVAVMTFDNKRSMIDKSNDVDSYDLTRFATDINYKIPGIADRLLKYFIKVYNPSKIISFGDRRWVLNGSNNMYTKLGFRLVSILKPDYRYYNPKISRNSRLHKFGFGKSNLRIKFPDVYSDNKTEWQMM